MIENVVIVGMGALGLMFGKQIEDHLGKEYLCFLMDADRKKTHALDEYRINGEKVSFRMVTPEEFHNPADLLIVATKYSGLHDAAKLIRSVVSPDTILVSLLNENTNPPAMLGRME